MTLNRRINEKYMQFISLKGEPHAIAFGSAIGVFVGITPTIPFHTILILLSCFLLKKNITAGYLGSWVISNPLTIPLLYLVQYRLGKYLLGDIHAGGLILEHSLLNLIRQGWDVFFPLLVGGIVMAPFFAVPTYFITRKIIENVRKNRHVHGEEHP